MRLCRPGLIAALLLLPPALALAQPSTLATKAAPHFPGAVWPHKTPAEAGMNAQLLKEAIDFAIASETKAPRNLKLNHYQTFGREPFGDAIGPIKDRGDQTGVIVRNGHIVAQWGEPLRIDMTHSVTKSFLSTTIGLAYDRRLIRTIDDLVHEYVAPVQLYNPMPAGNKADRFAANDLLDLFATPHNRTITWNHMLRQVSDWEGTLWGKPDWADRPAANINDDITRARHKPGTVYEYNDVRVNALALAALSVLRQPLPQVLKNNIMDPIGASSTWRWYGYENSWVVIDGAPMESMTGGGHWGGGMFIHAHDMARFGYLMQHRGRWNDRQIISDRWVSYALTPTPVQPNYGFMNFYVNDKKRLPSAPAGAFAFSGNGLNMVYVDPQNDLVAVVRWIDGRHADGFVRRLLASLHQS